MERQEVKLWCGLELGFHRSLEHSIWNQIFFAYDLLLLLSPILIGVLSPSVIGNHSFVKTSATMALGDCDPKSVGADRLELIATIIANKILLKRVIFTTFSILAGKKHTHAMHIYSMSQAGNMDTQASKYAKPVCFHLWVFEYTCHFLIQKKIKL